ncbi:DUF1292 domain-containing protein [Clostridium fallax]|uniref:Uncharacterized protein n=1 Tax=Clostridium fallax TaxID=1533 RepID=A0A1M4U6M2_9CLOT|nr:DUF1292 domain-containing protein [Clostridium fallax]SHE52217.1 Protein of unknown function [Clostridium fallax]SQB06099.1 Uncharacterized protein conserved in bacteria [Clostridium fallax]
MEIKEVMAFKDEDGNKVEFEVIAKIYLEEREKEYLILSPVENKESDDDAFVFRIDGEEGKEELNLVEDNDEFEEVKKEYKKLLY